MLFISLSVAVLFAISCSSLLPDQFEQFVDRVEKNAPTYDEDDWQKVSRQFSKLANQYEKVQKKLPKEDRKRIDKAIGRYHAIVLKSGIKSIINSFDDAAIDIVNGIESFLNELERE